MLLNVTIRHEKKYLFKMETSHCKNIHSFMPVDNIAKRYFPSTLNVSVYFMNDMKPNYYENNRILLSYGFQMPKQIVRKD